MDPEDFNNKSYRQLGKLNINPEGERGRAQQRQLGQESASQVARALSQSHQPETGASGDSSSNAPPSSAPSSRLKSKNFAFRPKERLLVAGLSPIGPKGRALTSATPVDFKGREQLQATSQVGPQGQPPTGLPPVHYRGFAPTEPSLVRPQGRFAAWLPPDSPIPPPFIPRIPRIKHEFPQHPPAPSQQQAQDISTTDTRVTESSAVQPWSLARYSGNRSFRRQRRGVTTSAAHQVESSQASPHSEASASAGPEGILPYLPPQDQFSQSLPVPQYGIVKLPHTESSFRPYQGFVPIMHGPRGPRIDWRGPHMTQAFHNVSQNLINQEFNPIFQRQMNFLAQQAHAHQLTKQLRIQVPDEVDRYTPEEQRYVDAVRSEMEKEHRELDIYSPNELQKEQDRIEFSHQERHDLDDAIVDDEAWHRLSEETDLQDTEEIEGFTPEEQRELDQAVRLEEEVHSRQEDFSRQVELHSDDEAFRPEARPAKWESRYLVAEGTEASSLPQKQVSEVSPSDSKSKETSEFDSDSESMIVVFSSGAVNAKSKSKTRYPLPSDDTEAQLLVAELRARVRERQCQVSLLREQITLKIELYRKLTRQSFDVQHDWVKIRQSNEDSYAKLREEFVKVEHENSSSQAKVNKLNSNLQELEENYESAKNQIENLTKNTGVERWLHDLNKDKI